MHPILINLKFLPIYSYGAMVALAFFIALALILRRADEAGVGREFVADLFLVILLSSIAGARALYVALNFNYFRQNPLEIVMIHHGGLVLYGGVFGAIIAAYIFTRKRGLSFLKVTDLFVPYLALGQALGRIGCYLNGCCFGKITACCVRVVFPRNTLPYFDHVDKSLISSDAFYSMPVYPVQLYSSLLDILMFVVLLGIDRKKKWDGQTFWAYLIMYPVIRFCMEFYRGDTPAVFFNFTLYQIISVGLFVFGVCGYLIKAKGQKYGK